MTQITTTVTEVKTTVTAITQAEQKALPERTGANEQAVVSEQIAFAANSESSQGEHFLFVANEQPEFVEFGANNAQPVELFIASGNSIQDDQESDQEGSFEQRIRGVLTSNPNLSDHKIAAIVGCSSSTVNKWRKRIEQAA
jgi:hypothetical protein